MELERPKSPWTPSYSVVRQGSAVTELLPEEKIDVEQLSPLVADEPTTAHAGFQSIPVGTTDLPVDDKMVESKQLSPPSEVMQLAVSVSSQWLEVG